MSNVIAFLERLGQNAQLRDATGDELRLALQGAQIHPGMWSNIVKADRSDLEKMLSAHGNVGCGLHAPEDEDEELAAAV